MRPRQREDVARGTVGDEFGQVVEQVGASFEFDFVESRQGPFDIRLP